MSTKSDWIIEKVFSNWHTSDRKIQVAVAGIIGSMLLCSAILVYVTGGTQYSYIHIVYVPILVGAFFFGAIGGISAGLLSGLVMGPVMPLDATLGTPQDPLSYFSRAAAFATIGAIAGIMFLALGRYLKIMRSQAFEDPITALPNRTQLLDDISRAKGRPAVLELDGAGRRPLRIVIVSIEPYSRVLATLGHDYADAMMRAAVARLKSDATRDAKFYDLREGILAVLVRSQSTNETVDYAHRLAECLGEPLIAKGIPILAECRFGVAGLVAGAGNPVTAIRAALAALEDAREQRSLVAVYDADRDDRRRQTVSLLADFQDALTSDNQLRLLLQPKIDLEKQKCSGFEALLRWHHPDRGNVPPDVFIPVVERTGLMRQLTQWVVRAALEQSVRLGREGTDLPIAVNISVHDLERSDFAEWLESQLLKFGVTPDRLEVEVTESAVMWNPDGALRTLADLRCMGIKMALDDFGTGQSSLAYLKDMAVDVVKLDRSLIRHLNDDSRSYALVKAVMDLSGSFGFATVAEGIEDAVTSQRLAELGCRTGQGYYFARPMPADAVAAWLCSDTPTA